MKTFEQIDAEITLCIETAVRHYEEAGEHEEWRLRLADLLSAQARILMWAFDDPRDFGQLYAEAKANLNVVA